MIGATKVAAKINTSRILRAAGGAAASLTDFHPLASATATNGTSSNAGGRFAASNPNAAAEIISDPSDSVRAYLTMDATVVARSSHAGAYTSGSIRLRRTS